MSGKISYGITTDGLIRYYDFANSVSLSGSSTTTWRDLSTSRVNATVTSGTPTFTGSYLGGVVFSGAPSGPIPSIPYLDLSTSSFAVDAWFTVEPNTVYLRGILSCGDIHSDYGTINTVQGWSIGYGPDGTAQCGLGVGIRVSGSGQVISAGVNSSLTGSVVNVFLHRNTNQNVVKIYINGNRRANVALNATASLSGNRNPITSQIWVADPGTQRPQNTFHSIAIYHNKNFTDNEIVANYLEKRGRYGL